MSTLYEINEAMLSCIDFETGEIIDEEKLNDLQMQRDEKIENVALWIKNLEANAAAFKAEKETFAEREKVANNKIKSLKKYLTDALGGEKFETTKCKISFRKSEKIVIAADAVIPEQFLKIKEPDVDKTALKKEIQAGLEIKGVSLQENKNISIK